MDSVEKYFEPVYLTTLVISMINWLLSAIEIGSKLAALGIAVLTIFYLYQKYKGQKLDNELKRKQLKDKYKPNK